MRRHTNEAAVVVMTKEHKEMQAEIDRLRAALWPFAMKGLKGTTVCADDFRRAKDAMPHAPDWAKPDQR